MSKSSTTEEKKGAGWNPTRKCIEGVPLVSEYKYLGTYLDTKLTMKTQIDKIKKKVDFIFVKLYPYLANATAEGRRDIWISMVVPLFESLYAIYKEEWATVNIEDVGRLWIGTFKKLMMIPKTTETGIVSEMIGIDFIKKASRSAWNAIWRWGGRMERNTQDIEQEDKEKVINYLRGVPNEWCKILKQQFSMCRICTKEPSRQNFYHMEKTHNSRIYNYKDIWAEIKKHHENKMSKQKKKAGLEAIKKISRTELLTYWKPILSECYQHNEEEYSKVYKKEKENESKM